MTSGSAVHVNVLGLDIVASMWCLPRRSGALTIERNTPRLSRRRVSREKNVSIAFNQEHEVGVKWNTKRWCRLSQRSTLGCFVGGVVVEDDVDHLAGRHRPLDRVEEADELQTSMARHALADDRAVEHIEGGEQGGGAVALVIEGHRAGLALLDGQARPGRGIQRLDIWLFSSTDSTRLCAGGSTYSPTMSLSLVQVQDPWTA